MGEKGNLLGTGEDVFRQPGGARATVLARLRAIQGEDRAKGLPGQGARVERDEDTQAGRPSDSGPRPGIERPDWQPSEGRPMWAFSGRKQTPSGVGIAPSRPWRDHRWGPGCLLGLELEFSCTAWAG